MGEETPSHRNGAGAYHCQAGLCQGQKPSTGLRCPCGGRFAGSSKVGGQLPIVKEFCAGAGRKLYRPCDSQPRPHPPHSVGRVYRQRQKRSAQAAAYAGTSQGRRGLHCRLQRRRGLPESLARKMPDVLHRGRSALHLKSACGGIGIPKKSA